MRHGLSVDDWRKGGRGREGGGGRGREGGGGRGREREGEGEVQ